MSRQVLSAMNSMLSSAVRSALSPSSVPAVAYPSLSKSAPHLAVDGSRRSVCLVRLKQRLLCTSRRPYQPRTPSDSCRLPGTWRGGAVFGLNAMLARIGGKLSDAALVCARQCHVIAALRLRRATQIVALYSNLGYDVQTLKRVIGQLAASVGRHLKNGNRKPIFALFSGAAVFNWEEKKIQEEQLKETAEEIGLIRRTSSSSSLMGVESDSGTMAGWEKVIDKENLAAYRKPLPNSGYLYEYKVFGTFHDIPARAFYHAQLDIEFRKQWDRLVVKLEVMEKDEESGTEVVQWITHFPYPMYQREYVYVRRAMVDTKKKTMVIVSRSTDHPCCPVTEKYVRVNTYMSNMVIRPHGNSFDENGFDYILTYHDDPQANFPTFAYNWMATTGVPDFVQKMHNAAKKLHENRIGGSKCQDYQQTNPM